MKRKAGDRVWIEGWHPSVGPHTPEWGTIGEDFDRYLILKKCVFLDDGNHSSWRCENEECRDWPTVALEHGGTAYDIYECEMHDGPDWRMQT